MKEIREAKYFIFLITRANIREILLFLLPFLPETVYPFFYYASTMAEKRGASSSKKQQLQVYLKIDFCPQQSQPAESLVFGKIPTVIKSVS